MYDQKDNFNFPNDRNSTLVIIIKIEIIREIVEKGLLPNYFIDTKACQ